jgi:hypothetical protein
MKSAIQKFILKHPNNKIAVIKMVREEYGLDLKEAKEMVDDLCDQMEKENPDFKKHRQGNKQRVSPFIYLILLFVVIGINVVLMVGKTSSESDGVMETIRLQEVINQEINNLPGVSKTATFFREIEGAVETVVTCYVENSNEATLRAIKKLVIKHRPEADEKLIRIVDLQEGSVLSSEL